MGKLKLYATPIISIVVFFCITCEPMDSVEPSVDPTTCEGCHTSQEALKKFASEPPTEPVAEGGG